MPASLHFSILTVNGYYRVWNSLGTPLAIFATLGEAQAFVLLCERCAVRTRSVTNRAA